jgi:hypothetical protein
MVADEGNSIGAFIIVGACAGTNQSCVIFEILHRRIRGGVIHVLAASTPVRDNQLVPLLYTVGLILCASYSDILSHSDEN